MTYLMWRLHRNQLLIAGGGLVLLAAALLLVPSVEDHTIQAIVYATITVPLLLGVFVGAPLLAREFEEGTNGLVWTQDVTRRRWLRSNLTWTIIAAAISGAAVTAVVTWWSLAEVSLGRSRLGPGPFDVQGVVPIAYAVFAVVLGVAVGAVVRRVLPAMAVTLAAFIVVRVVITVLVRPHFVSPVSRLVSITNSASGLPSGAWLLSDPSIVGPGGHNSPTPAPCLPRASTACLARHGFHALITYQPADRFWAFQGIETALYLVLAAGLAALAYRVVVRRDA